MKKQDLNERTLLIENANRARVLMSLLLETLGIQHREDQSWQTFSEAFSKLQNDAHNIFKDEDTSLAEQDGEPQKRDENIIQEVLEESQKN